MTTLALADWQPSPEIVIGKDERHRMTVAALTDIAGSSDHVDFLLYELDRARVVPDTQLPGDVIRLGSIVRYAADSGDERTIRLVMPDDVDPTGSYRLSVTSAHGAALLGLRPGAAMSWLGRDGAVHSLCVLDVSNPHVAGAA